MPSDAAQGQRTARAFRPPAHPSATARIRSDLSRADDTYAPSRTARASDSRRRLAGPFQKPSGSGTSRPVLRDREVGLADGSTRHRFDPSESARSDASTDLTT